MTDLRKAAEMALEALEIYGAQAPAVKETIEELRQALAQPEQEPVAWGIANTRPTEKNPLMMVMLDEPAPSHLVVPLYTAPPKKEWVGLTAPEVNECYDINPTRFASRIEAGLKQKNT